MIHFQRYQLSNGLRVILHEDESTPLVAVNMLYNVGSRDERPEKTGFAHLFEHLMFSGSLNAVNFDEPIQSAGGESNAFTNSDVTNYYEILPAANLEMALWLEADRMQNLILTERSLAVQKKVVLEEFKESCLNEPYGDVWHHLSDMAYKVHPYRWPTIGKVPKHIEDIGLEDVRNFYQHFYAPNNAILVVSGNFQSSKVMNWIASYFGAIPPSELPKRRLPKEPAQKKLAQRIKLAKVPVDALYLAFHAPARLENEYFAADLLSDVFANGPSSRLYRKLIKEEQVASTMDCYITGNIDPGLFIIEAKPATGVSMEVLEESVWRQIELMKASPLSDFELQKVKNKLESTLLFSEMNVLNKAINLAFFELLGMPDEINKEAERYQAVTAQDIQYLASQMLDKDNCSTLYYRAEKNLGN